MRLASFLLHDIENILGRWDEFARTLIPAATTMGPLALRDHAREILEAIAHDLATSATAGAPSEKAVEDLPIPSVAPHTATQIHALLRQHAGFDINQLAAEYRAFRSSVLQAWMDEEQDDETTRVDDIIRFNDAVDQALTESIAFFSLQVDQSRNLLLGMLGHDMRSPLQAIQMTASHLAALNAGETVSVAATRLIRSGARMQALLDDLTDFNRSKLGLGINVTPDTVNLGTCFAEELDLLRAAHPDCGVEFEVIGNTTGIWDGRRMQQVLGNLVLNAFRYGAPGEPVRVAVIGEEANVRLEVRNSGSPVLKATLDRIFQPLERGSHGPDADGHLGLGLYIAQQIAKAHGGSIAARSDQAETSFEVRLPRQM
jgi:signal transduction histidine kinase